MCFPCFAQCVLIWQDEIQREAIPSTDGRSGSSKDKEPDKSQSILTSFFSPTKTSSTPVVERRERTHRLFVSDSKTRTSGTLPPESDSLGGRLQVMLYKELLDAILLAEPLPDSATALSDLGVPLSATLPTEIPFSWLKVFAYLGIELDEPFSDHFLAQSAPVIIGNGLRFDIDQAKTLRDMIRAWERYVVELGLGTPHRNPSKTTSLKPEERNRGRIEDRLELVYRRAGAKKSSKGAVLPQSSTQMGDRSRPTGIEESKFSDTEQVEEMLLQYALNESLGYSNPPSDTAALPSLTGDTPANATDAVRQATPERTAQDVAEEESAWAVEVSLGALADLPVVEDTDEVVLRGSQTVAVDSPAPSSSSASSSRSSSLTPPLTELVDATMETEGETQPGTSKDKSKKTSEAGMIIGKTVFTHSPRRLAIHLASALQWWMGERPAVGVSVRETRRCGWCEFEENCEWR